MERTAGSFLEGTTNARGEVKTLGPVQVGGCNSLFGSGTSFPEGDHRHTLPNNRGFLDEAKLMAKFDPILKGHTIRAKAASPQEGRSYIR